MIGIYELRPRMQSALEPAGDGDPQVIGLTDAVQAPCLQVSIGQPWLLPERQAPAFFGRVQILAIGGRVEADGALDDLEDLVTYAITRLHVDRLPWAILEITAPRGAEIGGVSYLVARLTVQAPCDGTKARPAEVLEAVSA